MEIAFNDVFKFLITMLSILNPVGIIPIFLSLTSDLNSKQINSIAKSCSLTVMITILISLSIGKYVLGFFGIGVGAFTIAGGILIFTMALNMIKAKTNPSKLNREEQEEITTNHEEIGIVPLAIPLLSGPGAISTSIISAGSFNSGAHWAFATLAVLLMGLLIILVLSYGRKIGDKIGTIGLNVMTRVMGIILLALSIEMVVGGLKKMLPEFF